MEQLTQQAIAEMGQYAPGFTTQMVKVKDQEIIEVRGLPKNDPIMRLWDFYTIHELNLYSILFAFESEQAVQGYQDLVISIKNSLEFFQPSKPSNKTVH